MRQPTSSQRAAEIIDSIGGAVHDLDLPDDWWQPVRLSLLRSLPHSVLPPATRPVVTYISRQAAGSRRVNAEDNIVLERELKSLEPDYEVNIVQFEKLSRHEQIHMAFVYSAFYRITLRSAQGHDQTY